MIWDIFGLFLIVTLAIAGWNLGLRRSWTVPIGVVVATVLTQLGYVYVAAFLRDQLEMAGGLAVFIGYIATWLTIDISTEWIFLAFRSFRGTKKPVRWDRAAAAGVGAAKGAVLLLCASLAAIFNHSVLDPDNYSSMSAWLTEDASHSVILNTTMATGCGVPSKIAGMIVCSDAPTLSPSKPVTNKSDSPSTAAGKQVRDLFAAIKQLEAEAGR
jgi:hypothetical protein